MRKSIGIFAVIMLCLLGPQWAKADTCSAAGQLVTNCGFESSSSALTGWTLSGQQTTADGINVGVDQFWPFQGTNDAFISTTASETISQTIATTIGTLYTVSFELLAYPNQLPGSGDTNAFSATFGGLTLVNETNVYGSDATFPDYELFTGTFTATGTSTKLAFTGFNPDAAFGIDDTSVTAAAAPPPSVPEPGTFMLLGTGLVGLAGAVRRRLAA